ncbi:hypothetical protein ASPACDRAFT_44959 [Aspergillus aculeatus ATCC 16872]|uniref:Uncharacterized protein n=1 Tax=Aspergillus aculeatus (strain ATCC 16872 / CBS 172.66 / WB 5094) TaxID=690307 RepID=A0A1L9WQK1_ASPA1|nr:uncharacterized protein ASPACDRAFT_44959 [Aspergillus aculeatus ATCC 16872]OJJ98449.1 hypothetical protein ASPACDRAFT_44959 [Aspergillus aculeatus ATCC 16872]
MHRFILFVTALAALFTSTLAWSISSSFPLFIREDISPGSPLYECHADCGGVILMSQDDSNSTYCSNTTYKTELSGCLECALTYNIWQYYGDDVKSAAEACGDSATPSASSATASATAVANSTAASSGAKATGSSSASSSGSAASASATSMSGAAGASMSVGGILVAAAAVVGGVVMV